MPKENLWIRALKVYNKNNKDEFCIPKKGSGSYDTIKKLMAAPLSLAAVELPPSTYVPKGKKRNGKKRQ